MQLCVITEQYYECTAACTVHMTWEDRQASGNVEALDLIQPTLWYVYMKSSYVTHNDSCDVSALKLLDDHIHGL